MKGVVAAGHPLTADAGAQVLRAGGNAVDAALAAMATSFVAEPQLTGLGAGGFMLVAEPGAAPALLDFFVAAPGDGADPARRAPLVAAEVFFEAAAQVFHVGPSSCGVYGTPAGMCEAHRRYATVPLSELVAPAAAHARAGVEVNAQQAYIFDLLMPLTRSSAEAREKYWVGDRVAREGDVLHDDELAATLERLGAEGAAPFYTGDIAEAACAHVAAGGGMLTLADLAAYETIPREPINVSYRRHDVFTNPPPSAGGLLIAYVLALLDREGGPPSQARLVETMEAAQRARTPEFLEGLGRPGFLEEFLGSQLGSTTHISVMDDEGRACAVTCTNGEGSGVIVPGTGIHLNNMMGEEDLSPLGFFTHPPGRRLPSMMAPTVVARDGEVLHGARLGGLESHPLGHPAGDPRRHRPRAQPRRGGRGPARALGERDRLRRAGRGGRRALRRGLGAHALQGHQRVLRRRAGGAARPGLRRDGRRGRPAPGRRGR